MAREEGSGGGILASNTNEDRHEGLRVHNVWKEDLRFRV